MTRETAAMPQKTMQILEHLLAKKAASPTGVPKITESFLGMSPPGTSPALRPQPKPPAASIGAAPQKPVPAPARAAAPKLAPESFGAALRAQQAEANKLTFPQWQQQRQQNPNMPPPAYNAADYQKPSYLQRVFSPVMGPFTPGQQHEQAVQDYYGNLRSGLNASTVSPIGRALGYTDTAHPQDIAEGIEFANQYAGPEIIAGTPPIFATPAAGGVIAAARAARIAQLQSAEQAAFSASPAAVNAAQMAARPGVQVITTPSGAALQVSRGGGAALANATEGLPAITANAAPAAAAVPSVAAQVAHNAVPVAAVAGLSAVGASPKNIADAVVPPPTTTDGTEQAAAQATQPGQSPAPAAAQQPAPAQAAPADFQKLQETTTAVLQDAKATPQAKQESLQKLMQAHADVNPGLAAGLRDKLSGKTTEASAAFDKSFETAASDHIDKAYREWKANNPNSSPEADGDFIGQMTQQISAMPPAARLAMGLGLPLAVVGLGLSLFGGGGLGSMLMTLGLGAAGFGAASGGLFGADAQTAVNGGLSSLGQAVAPMLGMKLPNKEDIETRLTAAAQAGPEQANAELQKVRAELEPYARFSPDAQKFLAESADKNYMYNQAMNYGQNNFPQVVADEAKKDPWSNAGWANWFAKPKNDPNETLSNIVYGAPSSPRRDRIIADKLRQRGWIKQEAFNGVTDMNIAQQIFADQFHKKLARCWKGYEPVPGTKAYTEGSCRPAGSKKTKKEVISGKKHTEKKTEKKSAVPACVLQAISSITKQAEFSNTAFNHTIGPRPHSKATPDQTYNYQLSQSRQIVQNMQRNPKYVPPGWYAELHNYYGGKMPARPGVGAVPAQPASRTIPQPTQTAAAQAVKPANPPAPVSQPQTAPTTPLQRPIMTQMPPQPAPPVYPSPRNLTTFKPQPSRYSAQGTR